MNDIDKFLQNYSNILLDEHKEMILNYQSFLNKYINQPKITSRFGNHFTQCPWAQDTAISGPDSCECYYECRYKEKLLQLVNWYEKYVNKIKN